MHQHPNRHGPPLILMTADRRASGFMLCVAENVPIEFRVLIARLQLTQWRVRMTRIGQDKDGLRISGIPSAKLFKISAPNFKALQPSMPHRRGLDCMEKDSLHTPTTGPITCWPSEIVHLDGWDRFEIRMEILRTSFFTDVQPKNSVEVRGVLGRIWKYSKTYHYKSPSFVS